jgi:phage terminase Nu1 subunit (DNA packaging protein)
LLTVPVLSDSLSVTASARSKPDKNFKVIDAAPEVLADVAANWSLSEAARRKEIALALTRQLQYDRAKGKVVSVEQIRPAWFRVVTAVRTAMLAVPTRLRLSAPSLTAAQLAIITREIREGLHRAAGGETLETPP